MSSSSDFGLWLLVLSVIFGVGLCNLNKGILESLTVNDWKDQQTITIHIGYKTYIVIFLLLAVIQIFILYRSRLCSYHHCLKRANSVKIMLQKSMDDDDLSDSTQSEFEYHETSDSETSESNQVVFPNELL